MELKDTVHSSALGSSFAIADVSIPKAYFVKNKAHRQSPLTGGGLPMFFVLLSGKTHFVRTIGNFDGRTGQSGGIA